MNTSHSVVESSGVVQYLERQYKAYLEKERVTKLQESGYTYRKCDFKDTPELFPTENRSISGNRIRKKKKRPKIKVSSVYRFSSNFLK